MKRSRFLACIGDVLLNVFTRKRFETVVDAGGSGPYHWMRDAQNTSRTTVGGRQQEGERRFFDVGVYADATSQGVAEQDRSALVAKRDSPSASSRTLGRTAAGALVLGPHRGCSEGENCTKTNPSHLYLRGASRD